MTDPTAPAAPLRPAAPAVFPGGPGLFRLDPEVAHLNHGSFGAVPLPVQEAQAALRAELHADPDAFFIGAADRIAGARARVARHFGADPDGMAFIANATEGANLALDAVPFADGDEILVTDHGYGTVVGAAARRARVNTVALDPYLPDEDAVRETVLAGLTPRTKVALLDHISSPTARLIASPRLLADLAARGVTTIVDGAHVPGMVADPLAGGAGFWFGNLHKWGYAPSGSAVLAVAPAHRGRVRALVPSWEDADGFPAPSRTAPPPTTPDGSPPPRAWTSSTGSTPRRYGPTTAPSPPTARPCSARSPGSPRSRTPRASRCAPCGCRPAPPRPRRPPAPCASGSRRSRASGCWSGPGRAAAASASAGRSTTGPRSTSASPPYSPATWDDGAQPRRSRYVSMIQPLRARASVRSSSIRPATSASFPETRISSGVPT